MSQTTSTDIEMIVDTSLMALTETDPVRRAELIGQAWSEDGSLTDPPLVGEGHAGLNDFAVTVYQHYAGEQFRRVTGSTGTTTASAMPGNWSPPTDGCERSPGFRRSPRS